MFDHPLIDQLSPLAEEYRGCGEWPDVEVNAALLLYDVCTAAKVPEGGIELLLGEEGMEHVRAILESTPGTSE